MGEMVGAVRPLFGHAAQSDPSRFVPQWKPLRNNPFHVLLTNHTEQIRTSRKTTGLLRFRLRHPEAAPMNYEQ
jgi:hypothetical protein